MVVILLAIITYLILCIMIQKRTIPVVGMACSSCSAHVEKTLSEQKGVASASVNLATRAALVEYDDAVITLEQMKAAVNAIGFDLVIEQDRSVEEIERREYTLLKRKTLLAWLFAVGVMGAPLILPPAGGSCRKPTFHDSCTGLPAYLRPSVLCVGLAAATTWHGEYGYTRSLLHRHLVSL